MKYVSPDDAMALVPTGATIVTSGCCGAPNTLLAALSVACVDQGWTLESGLLLGDLAFAPAVRTGDLRYRSWHVLGESAVLFNDGLAEYVPLRASRVPTFLRERPPTVAIVRMTPPDRHGRSSLGPSAAYARAALEAANIRIAEIDPDLPWTLGDSTVDSTAFDALVEARLTGTHYERAAPHEVADRVIDHLLELIPTEPTLQIGLGAIPEHLVSRLARTGLGPFRFVGMATDAMADLVDELDHAPAGPYPAIFSPDLMGSRALMTFAHRNRLVGVHPSTVAHDPRTLARFPRLVSVVSAIEIDLLGQVNSESVRGRRVSGIGGSRDFVEAAINSTEGRRIVCLPSATPSGSASRIVNHLQGPVTIPSSGVDYVVTEHGVARLAGLSARARAEALIEIAHPAHRDALTTGRPEEAA